MYGGRVRDGCVIARQRQVAIELSTQLAKQFDLCEPLTSTNDSPAHRLARLFSRSSEEPFPGLQTW
jgi:hypothetical protein